MAKKQLSIYVGTNRTRICEVVRTSATNIAIYNAIEVATPEGAVEDGHILDVPALAEAIKACIYGRGLSTTSVSFTIASKKIATKEVTIPYVKADKIRAIIEANANEYFPMNNLGDYVFADSVLETVSDDEGKRYRITAVAAPKDIVRTYYELSDELKIPVGTIDYTGNSVFQVLELQMSDDKVSMVLQIEKENTYISVLKGKTMILQRSVPYGKNAIVKNLSDIKRITERDSELLLQDEARLHAAVTDEEFAETMQFMINGIGRVMDYYMSRHSSMPVEEIKLFGEGCQTAGVANMLQNELHVEVIKILDFKGITIKDGGSLNKNDILKYIACVGAVLQPVKIQIAGYNKKKKGVGVSTVEGASGISEGALIGILIGAVIFMIVVVAGTGVFYMIKNSTKDKLQAKVDSLQEAQTIADAYELAKVDSDLIDNFYLTTMTPNENLRQFILDLEKVLPTAVAVSNLSVNEGAVTISAKGTSKEEVADLLISLKETENVLEPYVTNMTQTYGAFPEVNFNITLQLADKAMPGTELEETETEEGAE